MLQSRSVNVTDVHCDSLIDLLCKHGILQQQNWQKDLDRIKSAFPDALALIPGDLNDTLEVNTTISTLCFWRCEQIFAFLLQRKESKQEAGKSWLGKYKDRLLYKWDLILRTYRRHHVFLAESAVLMVHNSTFEIPGLKKEIKTLESRADFLNRKIEEITSQVGEHRTTIDLFCKENGITSSAPTRQSIRTDVNRMVRIKLPSLLTQIHCTIRKEQIQQGIALYRCFSNFLGFEASPEDGIKQKDELLHTLNTFYYYSGPVVDKSKLSDICLDFESTRDNLIQGDEIGSEVDWNVDIDVVNGQDGDGEINWDIDAEVAEAASRTMSDGTNHFSEEHIFEADAHLDPEMADLGIDIEIDAEGDLEMGEVDISDDINDSMLVEYSLVDPSMREALNNDLLELKCFLDQRCQEMETDEGNMYFTLTRDAPKVRMFYFVQV